MARRRTITSLFVFAAMGVAAIGATPAAAQFSDSFNFLKAVRDGDGQKVTDTLHDKGSTILDTREFTTGEGALSIVIKRRDLTWTNFLLSSGANPNIRDNAGDTAMIKAAAIGFNEAVELLLAHGGQINLANSRGETPLIIATQQRNLALVRILLSNGADPRQADRIAGKSAHDYAAEDPRSAAVLKLLDESQTVVKPKPRMSGPGL